MNYIECKKEINKNIDELYQTLKKNCETYRDLYLEIERIYMSSNFIIKSEIDIETEKYIKKRLMFLFDNEVRSLTIND